MELEKIGNKFSNACEAQEVINLLKNIGEMKPLYNHC
jgi:hypothetical protein